MTSPSSTPSPSSSATPTSAPTPTVTPTTNPASGTESAPVGDLAGWKQIFVENFTTPVSTGNFPGTAYASTWSVYPDGWKDTSGNGTYAASKVLSVHNGMLDMDLHTENGTTYVAAPVPTLPGASAGGGLTYGRYSVRYRADSVAGFKTAWLLWPDSGSWPNDGEIDFPEGSLNGTIGAYAHYASSSGGQDAFETKVNSDSWHVATTEWTAGKISFYLDGVLIGTSTHSVPSKPMHWVLQTETALDGTRPSASAVAHVYVDWVTAYSPA